MKQMLQKSPLKGSRGQKYDVDACLLDPFGSYFRCFGASCCFCFCMFSASVDVPRMSAKRLFRQVVLSLLAVCPRLLRTPSLKRLRQCVLSLQLFARGW